MSDGAWSIFSFDRAEMVRPPAHRPTLPTVTLDRDGLARALGRLERARVGVGGGRGLGHLGAATALVGDLRALGFRGEIELAIEPEAVAKLGAHLPGFDPRRADQRLPGRLRCLAGARAVERAGPIDLGLVAACDDRRSWMGRLGVRRCLVLQPFDWPAERWIETDHGVEILDLPESSTYVHALPRGPRRDDPAAWRSHVSATFAAYGRPNDPRIDGLSWLLGAARARLVDLLPVYGLHHPALEGRERRILDRLRAALDDPRPRPAVLLVFGDRRGAGRGLEEPGLASRLAAGEVATIEAGVLPEPLFRLVFATATLPPVVEGAGSSNLAQLLGRRFLSIPTGTTRLPPLPGAEAEREAITRLSAELAEPESPSAPSGRVALVCPSEPPALARQLLAAFVGPTPPRERRTRRDQLPAEIPTDALAILDLTDPSPDALALVEALARRTRVFVIGRRDDPATLVRSRAAGAVGQHSLPDEARALHEAVHRRLVPSPWVPGRLRSFFASTDAQGYGRALARAARSPARRQLARGLERVLGL